MLLVADMESVAYTLGALLESGGYPGDIVASTPEALAKIEQGWFDGLFVALRRQTDRLALVRRARELLPTAWLVVVADDSCREAVSEALVAGADDVLGEPLTVAALQTSLWRSEHWRSQLAALDARNAALERLAEERDAARRLAEEHAAALADLDRMKDDFLMTAGHDLKGPLTSIRGHSQLLLRSLRSKEPDLARLARGLLSIDAATVAMAHLLNHLLDASRVQASRLDLRPAPCDMGECLAAVQTTLSPEEGDRVLITLDNAPLAGQWERVRIEQVLANLVRNALKYSPPTARVTVWVERVDDTVAVAVRDEGMGIPADELPRLFTRFHRTPQAHESGVAGTGLGLYICRGIVEAHGGRIWAESAGEGQGATFRFTLPAEPAERRQSGNASSSPSEERWHTSMRRTIG
jgi:signal transduction histidine kinase